MKAGRAYRHGSSVPSLGAGYAFPLRFSRGDRVRIISGKHKGATGTIAASVFQRSVDLPDEHTPCYHVLLDCELVVTVNVKQVEALI